MKNGSVAVLVALLFTFSVSADESIEARATAAYMSGDYAESGALFAEAARLDPLDTRNLYNGACSYALAGSLDGAFDLLAKAVDGGYSNVEGLEKDSDLVSLRDDTRWAPLVARVTKAKEVSDRFWAGKALVGSYTDDLPVDLRIAGLSRLWSEARYNFANFDLVPELDLDALYLEYLPRVREAADTASYYRVLAEFTAHLKDGHTSVWPPRQLSDRMLARPAIRTRLIQDRVLVVEVPDEQLRASGLTDGAEIVAIDGTPVREYAEKKIRPWQASSTPQDSDVRTYDYNLLVGAAGTTVALTVRNASGTTSTHEIERLSRKGRAEALPPRPPFEMRELPGHVLHISLNTFNDRAVYDEFIANFETIAQAEALILDVRNNGGGNSSWGWRILSTLTDEELATSSWDTRLYRPAYRAWGFTETRYRTPAGSVGPDGERLYSGPVVVVTSPRTFSAAEDFAVAFDVMDRGLIVGESTGGSTGQPIFFRLPGGGSARICAKRDRYPDGSEFIGVGVVPDIEVAPTVEDVRQKRDTVLERALEVVRTRRDAPAR
jgi:C-terminal processing protease CtpA/Prc